MQSVGNEQNADHRAQSKGGVEHLPQQWERLLLVVPAGLYFLF